MILSLLFITSVISHTAGRNPTRKDISASFFIKEDNGETNQDAASKENEKEDQTCDSTKWVL